MTLANWNYILDAIQKEGIEVAVFYMIENMGYTKDSANEALESMLNHNVPPNCDACGTPFGWCERINNVDILKDGKLDHTEWVCNKCL